MKRFTIPCTFAGRKSPFHVYVGQPAHGLHPLKFQAAWLREQRGGIVPPEVMDNFDRLFQIAQEQDVSFEDLCVYALGSATTETRETTGSKEEPLTE